MSDPSHISLPLKVIAWLWGTLFLLTTMVSAQQPLSTHSMGYTTVDDNTLYILGGAHYPDSISQSNFTYQFVSLDLTSNWDTTNPPWKTLPYPSNYLSDLDINRYSLLASPDSRKFSLLKITETNFVYDYNVDSGSWTQAMALSRYTLAGRGLRAVIDPSTGLVYIPGAGLSLDNSEMVIIDPSTGSTFGAHWYVMSVFGAKSFTGEGEMCTADTDTQFQQPTVNSSPSFRIRSCMVSAYNGSKIVLFGGDMNGPSVAAISVFDVASSTWSDGPSASDARSGMACSVSGDNFIVWGGEKFTSAVEVFGVPSAPLIYNIRTNQWTTQFMAAVNPGHPGPTGPGGGGSGGSGNGDAKSNGAAIGGGIAGAVVVVTIIAFLFIRRRRQQNGHTGSSSKDSGVISRHNHDPVLLSMENTHNGTAALSEFAQTQTEPSELHINSKHKMAPMLGPQSITNSLHSDHTSLQGTAQTLSPAPTSPPQLPMPAWSPVPPPSQVSTWSSTPTYVPSPMIPPRPYSTANPASPQYHNQSLDHHTYQSQEQLPLQSNNPQYDPMAAWSPTHTYVPVSMIPPRPYSTVNPSSPQDYNQQLDHQPDHIQEQHSPHNNPQYDPTGTQTLLSPAVRAPHATTVPESGASDQELLEKINSLQGEWIRRQAKQQR